MNLALIEGPVVVLRVSERAANRIRMALVEQMTAAQGEPFERDWEDLVAHLDQEVNTSLRRRSGSHVLRTGSQSKGKAA